MIPFFDRFKISHQGSSWFHNWSDPPSVLYNGLYIILKLSESYQKVKHILVKKGKLKVEFSINVFELLEFVTSKRASSLVDTRWGVESCRSSNRNRSNGDRTTRYQRFLKEVLVVDKTISHRYLNSILLEENLSAFFQFVLLWIVLVLICDLIESNHFEIVWSYLSKTSLNPTKHLFERLFSWAYIDRRQPSRSAYSTTDSEGLTDSV